MPPESSPHTDPKPGTTYAEPVTWKPQRPRFHLIPVVVSWVGSAVGLLVAAYILPGRHRARLLGRDVGRRSGRRPQRDAPPILAALRLPFTVGLGFILVLLLDA